MKTVVVSANVSELSKVWKFPIPDSTTNKDIEELVYDQVEVMISDSIIWDWYIEEDN